MSRLSLKALQAAAGAAAGGAVYVDDVFSTYLYDGTGSAQTITNGIDLDGEGGLVWIKGRGPSAFNHILEDTARGADRYLRTNTTNAELIGGGGVTAFNSNGFTTGTNGAVTASGDEFASWTFRKQPGFFDVVTYTGNGLNPHVINHNLGATPGMIIQKAVSRVGNWTVWHRSLATNHNMFLNSTSASSAGGYLHSVTDSSFTVNSDSELNQAGQTYIAYLFAHDAQEFGTDEDESIIKCGSYTGNGSTTGPIIDLGFEPQWVMIKNISFANDWWIFDSMRGITSGGADSSLRANLSSSENTGTNALKVTATGFQLENGGGDYNGSTQQYIYVAIRRPHKPAEEFAATDLFAVAEGGGGEGLWVSGFPVDMAWHRSVTVTVSSEVGSRLASTKYLKTDSTAAEFNDPDVLFDYMNGWFEGGRSSGWYSWMFRRAPGFFDVVAYKGTGSARTVPHNLGVAPELMIIKNRDRSTQWTIYSSDLGISYHTFFNGAASVANGDTFYYFNSTAPTESVFSLGTATYTNQNGEALIAYLFASVPGISKVGSYTGTGSDVDVDCGFTSGARFVLVKRTDSTGDWYVWDSVRGIVAGNDPYVLLNSTAVQVTSTDYIDPLSSGFTITSSAPAALNASGGTYIFLAIA